MTNYEATIIAMSFNIGVDEGEINKALIDFGLVPTDEYTAANKCMVNAAAGIGLSGQTMLKSISEGGFSVSFDIDGIKSHLAFLANNSCGLFTVPDELRVSKRRVRARFMH